MVMCRGSPKGAGLKAAAEGGGYTMKGHYTRGAWASAGSVEPRELLGRGGGNG